MGNRFRLIYLTLRLLNWIGLIPLLPSMEGYFLKRTLQTWQLEARNEAHPLQTMASRGLILSSPVTCLTFQAKKANPTFYLALQFMWEIHMPSKMSYLARACQVTQDRKCYTAAVGARPARKSTH